ncbi:hypothetical protein [Actinophytocola sp.]|uniref:hypothetical protein n=1 Tax=Actinophytocola sp. TaxID=1872138 RepID=UPI002D80474C|nr:hypothetical protein [Actinophytocola sp.]HET9143682.1 hypothetical protein [Actinophytocola sp.]
MYTEDDLRAVFGDVEREAPELSGTLAGLDRLARRRTVRRTALGMAAAVVTTVAIAATALVVTNLTEDHQTPAAPPAAPLRLTFAVDPIAGKTVRHLARDATKQRVTLNDAAGTINNDIITVYAPGAFDPSEARTGEPVEVHGRTGYFRPDLPCQCETEMGYPTIAWEYADNAWATAVDMKMSPPHQLPPEQLKANQRRIAEAVRFDRTTPLLIPFRVGYLPAGVRPRSANLALDARGTPRMVELGWPAAGDINIEAGPNLTGQLPVGETALGPGAVTVPDRLGEPKTDWVGVNFGSFGVRVRVTGLTKAELLRIMQSITPVADFADPDTWFDAEEAIPNG